MHAVSHGDAAEACIRLGFNESKVVVVIDLRDSEPDGALEIEPH